MEASRQEEDRRYKVKTQYHCVVLFVVLGFVSAVQKPKYRIRLGENIRSFRERKQFSQEKLAEKADLHHNSIGQFERGESEAKLGTLVRIAKVLGVTVRDLVEGI
jgi:DNA-binding XRE family transcriptional regulator